MKPTFAFWHVAALLGLFAPLAQAQTGLPQTSPRPKVAPVPATNPASSDRTSWLFLLQTKTQWLLVVQENNESGTSSESSGNGSDSQVPNAPAGSGGGGTGQTSDSQPQNDAVKGGEAKKPDESNASTLIFEGNTLDIPLEPNPEKSPTLPVKPSAPGS